MRAIQQVLQDSVAAAVGDARPEGFSVFVATRDEATARAVGPMLVERLYPGMRHGGVLHTEHAVGRRGEMGTEVVVEVLR